MDEVAAMIIDGDETVSKRDILIRPNNAPLQHISEMSEFYAAMHYVLMFPMGERDWSDDLKHTDNKKRMTQREFYAYL